MKTQPVEGMRGSFGPTEISVTPQSRRTILMDVRNCAHCGGHHASLAAEVAGDRVTVYCPSLGGRPLVMTAKLFLHAL